MISSTNTISLGSTGYRQTLEQHRFTRSLPDEQYSKVLALLKSRQISKPQELLDIIQKSRLGTVQLNNLFEVLLIQNKKPLLAVVANLLGNHLQIEKLRVGIINTASCENVHLLEWLCLYAPISLELRLLAITPSIFHQFTSEFSCRSDAAQVLGGLEVEIQRQANDKGICYQSCLRVIAQQRNEQFNLNLNYLSNLSDSDKPDRSRKTNPLGCERQRSFAKLVELKFYDCNKLGKATKINDFIETVLAEWGVEKNFSREDLSQHIQRVHPKGLTISNVTFYKWKNYRNIHPYPESIKILVEAFALSRTHEIMLWRLAGGVQPKIALETLVEQLNHKISAALCQGEYKAEARKSHSMLIKTLVAASGIPSTRMQKMLGMRQLWNWTKGSLIQSPEKAANFVNLTNPLFLASNEEHRQQIREVNEKLILALQGRLQSVDDAIKVAETYPNPGGQLLKFLTGRHGLKPLSATSMAKLLGVSVLTVARIRSSTIKRGGYIDEALAHKIVDYWQGIDIDQRSKLATDQQLERKKIINTLTVIKDPVSLFEDFKAGKLNHIGQVILLARTRRGRVQIPSTHKLEFGKDFVGFRKAQQLADYLGFVGDEMRETRRQFILAVMGRDYNQDLSSIILAVKAGQISRLTALRTLCDLSGMTRPQIASAISIKYEYFQQSLAKVGDGFIVSRLAVEKLAKLLALESYQQVMLDIFNKR